ncbi:hypothetical protein DIPPA_02104 [Diplonema papillatum]|nr:hypothetical protein DIPPA_02104 [Diplonema papillatum]
MATLDDMVAKKTVNLTDASRSMLETVVRLSKERKVVHTKELEYELGRYQKSMLREGVYSKRDVETLLSSFFTALQGTIQYELRAQMNISAELLAQLFSCAAAKGLSLDPPRIPGAVADATPAFMQKDSLSAGKMKLASLESVTADEAKVTEELRAVERENERLQEKIERITKQFQDMMQVKAEVGQQLNDSKAEVGVLQDKGGGADPKEVAQLKGQIEKLRKEHESAHKTLVGKLNDSPQFVNLKKMLAKKNADLAKLREDLQNHELVYADDEDDPNY